MIIFLSLLVALIGFVWCILTDKPKHEKLAVVMFACGLLAFLLKAESVVTMFQAGIR